MKYIDYVTIDSTNNEAKRLINEGKISEITCISAGQQTNGRGRQGKSFFSPDTGLYMTMVFPLDCEISSQVTMTTRTACAVADAIEECTGQSVGIKWVNDIYIRNKKCCGILCEAVNDYELGHIKHVIIGIGINVYTKEWPEELKEIAGSLYEDANLLRECPEYEGDISLKDYAVICNTLKRSIAEKIRIWLFNISGKDFIEYYKKRSIVLGKKIFFIADGEKKEGLAVDIDENGGLVVDMKNNGMDTKVTLNSGEISVRAADLC